MSAKNMHEAEILVRLARAGVPAFDLDKRLKEELEFEAARQVPVGPTKEEK